AGNAMRRRDFIKTIGAAATGWPLAARAQPDGRVRRIGILTRGTESNRVVQAQLDDLREGLAKLGWTEGRNVRFDIRLSDDDPERLRALADELVHLGPEVIVGSSQPATRTLLLRTPTIPIVFVNVGDPVASGLLKNVARPEGNVTGATSQFEPSIAGK